MMQFALTLPATVACWLAVTGSPARPAPRASVNMAAGESALIIQNKGGGHGEIGYHLALKLAQEKDMSVTILHEGPNTGKPPHDAYGALDAAGVTVHWCEDLADSSSCLAKLGDSSFNAIVDNWSKSPEAITPYAKAAQDWGVSSYSFISSAGMYTPPRGDFSAISEECSVKSSGQRQAEETIAEMGLPYSYFRPQYIYGPNQGKSYLGFFFDRLTRGKPVPVPNGGDQQVSMTHAADNAAMVAAAVCNPAAVGEAFNCATSNTVTYDELVRLCAKAAGVEATIAHYDPAKIPEGSKFKFPFRNTPFFVDVSKASKLLGFVPANNIAEDIGWYYNDNYVGSGGAAKEVDLSVDAPLL